MPRSPFQLRMSIPPQWEHIERLQQAVGTCLSLGLSDDEFCDALMLVSGELLENAIKYGDWAHARDQQELDLHIFTTGEASTVVEVANPIDLSSEHLERAKQMVQHINSARSPIEAYQARMVEIGGSGEEGGLGLHRIAYQGNCWITTYVEGSTLRMKAFFK